MSVRPTAWTALLTLVVLLPSGCSDGLAPEEEVGLDPPKETPILLDSGPPMTVDMSGGHPTEGPHNGDLIELGEEDYHAELVHEEQGVTIFVLDAAAKTLVPIEAPDIRLNVVHDGRPEQFTLQATPDATDPVGRSSRFRSTDAELAATLNSAGTKATLVLTINGTSFRGEVLHDHDGHEHADDH